MPSGDEKVRLLPVLSTILKLSPAEMEQIQKSINGESCCLSEYQVLSDVDPKHTNCLSFQRISRPPNLSSRKWDGLPTLASGRNNERS